jgi:predicted dehydrogenase
MIRMNKKVKEIPTIALIGAGSRGYGAYGRIIKNRNDVKIVAVAEPDGTRRSKIAIENNIPENMQFNSWEELLSKDRLADGVIITTLDRMHVQPTIAAIEKGYYVLLEKPIAPTPEEVAKLLNVVEDRKGKVMIGHVLRYSDFFQKIKELIDSKIIGNLIGIDHEENVGFWHFAHSFVRGRSRKVDISSPSILAKSCHDMDILYWLVGTKCKEISSFGELSYFKKENQPKGATERCIDCPVEIESKCPYSAKKIYLINYTDWPVSDISADLSYEGKIKALKEGPFGKCVYSCDNDVVDHQISNMTFENGVKVSFTMTAFTDKITRTIRVFGSLGEIRGDFEKGEIEVINFANPIRNKYELNAYLINEGHGGGDVKLVEDFIEMMKGNKRLGRTEIRESAHSHFMAFAAEESRLNKKTVNINEYEKRYVNKGQE